MSLKNTTGARNSHSRSVQGRCGPPPEHTGSSVPSSLFGNPEAAEAWARRETSQLGTSSSDIRMMGGFSQPARTEEEETNSKGEEQ